MQINELMLVDALAPLDMHTVSDIVKERDEYIPQSVDSSSSSKSFLGAYAPEEPHPKM